MDNVKLGREAREIFISCLRNNMINNDFAKFMYENFTKDIPYKERQIIVEIIDRPEQVKKDSDTDTDKRKYYAPNKALKRLFLGVLCDNSINRATANKIASICQDLAALDDNNFIRIIDLTHDKIL